MTPSPRKSYNGALSDLAVIEPLAGSPALRPAEVQRVLDYIGDSWAPSTTRVYRHAWASFCAWCEARHIPPVPDPAITGFPAVVAAYLAEMADSGFAYSTINVAISAINQALKLAGSSPVRQTLEVERVLKGIRRKIGVAPDQAAPLLLEDVRAAANSISTGTPRGLRNRALLLIGFASAMRRSELAAMRRGDLNRTEHGYIITIPFSKTDQEGAGHQIGIPIGRTKQCPVLALDAWLDATADVAPDAADPVWLRLNGRPGYERTTDEPMGVDSFVRLIKRIADDLELEGRFSGHSLRAGFVTSALEAGASVPKIMEQTRHKSVDTLNIYVRRANLFKDNPAAGML